MLHAFLNRLPAEPPQAWLAMALAVAGIGLLFLIAGARLSRSIYALAGVACGAWLGLQSPGLFGWSIDGMGPSIAGALLGGLAGWLLHTTLIGLTLGVLSASVGILLAWNHFAPGQTWAPPAIDWSQPYHLILKAVWKSLPGELPQVMPLVSGAACAAGVLITVIWPKLGRVITFSLLGALLLVGGGVVAMRWAEPGWLGLLPSGVAAQVAEFLILVTLSAAVQWKLYPSGKSPCPSRAPHDAPAADVGELGATTLGPLGAAR